MLFNYLVFSKVSHESPSLGFSFCVSGKSVSRSSLEFVLDLYVPNDPTVLPTTVQVHVVLVIDVGIKATAPLRPVVLGESWGKGGTREWRQGPSGEVVLR